MFHLSGGTAINVMHDDVTAKDNSAYQGGFAYLEGAGTRMTLRPSAVVAFQGDKMDPTSWDNGLAGPAAQPEV